MEPPLEKFTVKDVKGVAPTTKEADVLNGRPETEAFVHCEVALALAMESVTQDSFEIGVSKACCWPCFEFLSKYSEQTQKIIISATNSKFYHNWLFPEVTTSDFEDQMDRTARLEFSAWLLSLDGRRTSDSHADSSSDEDPSPDEHESFILRKKKLTNSADRYSSGEPSVCEQGSAIK